METQRLLFRRFECGDLNDFYEYARGKNVGPNAGWQPHTDISVTSQILDIFIKDEGELAIVHKFNNKVIGSLGFRIDTKRNSTTSYMIGYCLSEDYWGIGLMTEAVNELIKYAFEQCAVTVLSVYHFPSNVRSESVIRKCGFTYEGRLRQSYRAYSGEVYDEICYSILREEYFLKKLADSL